MAPAARTHLAAAGMSDFVHLWPISRLAVGIGIGVAVSVEIRKCEWTKSLVIEAGSHSTPIPTAVPFPIPTASVAWTCPFLQGS